MLDRLGQRSGPDHVRAPAQTKRLSPDGQIRSGMSARHSEPSERPRTGSTSRSRPIVPTPTTRPAASRRSPTASRSTKTWSGGTSPINAMAVRLPSHEFVDPHGGLTDLARRVIRTPSTPESSFSDDPLRMLRAARFAAQLGFEVSPDVVTAMTDMADRIAHRVRRTCPRRAGQADPVRPAPARADSARRHRAGRPGAAGAAGVADGDRRASPAQERVRALADRPRAGDRPGGPPAGRRARPRDSAGRHTARHRQADGPAGSSPAAA